MSDVFKCMKCGHLWEQKVKRTSLGPNRSADLCPRCSHMYATWLTAPKQVTYKRPPPCPYGERT